MTVDADELLKNDAVPQSVKKVIRQEKRKTAVQARRSGFYIVGIAQDGREVQPGKRTYSDGTDRTYRERN
ncbi:MAG: hypothetical protein ACYDAN_01865 [Candidatus Limnocylindrales bacterium]